MIARLKCARFVFILVVLSLAAVPVGIASFIVSAGGAVAYGALQGAWLGIVGAASAAAGYITLCVAIAFLSYCLHLLFSPGEKWNDDEFTKLVAICVLVGILLLPALPFVCMFLAIRGRVQTMLGVARA